MGLTSQCAGMGSGDHHYGDELHTVLVYINYDAQVHHEVSSDQGYL